MLKNGILSVKGRLPRGKTEWDEITAKIGESRDVQSHTFEMKGLYLGISEPMPLIILRASGGEKNFIQK